MKKAGAVLTLLIGSVLTTGIAQAGFTSIGGSIDLYTLINTPGASFTIGDKTFSGFSYTTPTTTGHTQPDAPLAPLELSIQPGTFNGNIGFQLNGIIKAQATNGSGGSNSFLDAQFSYVVTATSPLIEDVGSNFNGNCSGSGFCSVSLVESATATSQDAGIPDGTLLAQLTVTNPPPNAAVQDDKLLLFNGSPVVVKQLAITKDIELEADTDPRGVGLTTASISFLDQYFSQVPEPASYLVVLGTGLFVMFYFVRRRRIS
jgi:hypothetical protein